MHFMTRDEASTRMLVSASHRRRTENRPAAEGPAAKQQAGLGVLSDNAPLHKSIARLHAELSPPDSSLMANVSASAAVPCNMEMMCG